MNRTEELITSRYFLENFSYFRENKDRHFTGLRDLKKHCNRSIKRYLQGGYKIWNNLKMDMAMVKLKTEVLKRLDVIGL